MPAVRTLRDAFINELHSLLDAERQLAQAVSRFARAATSRALRDEFERHLQDSEAQRTRFTRVFSVLGETPAARRCDGMAGVIAEANAMLDEPLADVARDACLVAVGQRAARYASTAYATVITWAEAMGHRTVAHLLQHTLAEKRSADARLSRLADNGITEAAADAVEDDDAVERSLRGIDDHQPAATVVPAGETYPQ